MQCAFSHPNYLALVGLTGCALPKATSGAPIWPTGVVGSLSHDSRVAVAAVGRRRDFSALEINIEPAAPLPSELLDLVATPQERAEIGEDPYHGRLLLAAKEAVSKRSIRLITRFLTTMMYGSVLRIAGLSCATVEASNFDFAFLNIC